MVKERKITPEMHDDIIMWRSQGYSWEQISKKLLEEYNVEIQKSSVYRYYKNNLEKNAQARLKELYEEQKGEGAAEKELVKDIEVLNLAIEVGKEILVERKFKTAHQYQATVSGVCTAIKTKTDVLIGQENESEQEDFLINLLKARGEGDGDSPI